VGSSPAVDVDGTIYVGSDDHNLYAVNPDGSLKWLFPAGPIVYSSPAVDVDGTIYFGSYDFNLYAVH
jgi:large repetitive protein